MKVHTPHVQPIKTKKFGPDLSAMDMQNNPFRAAHLAGHELNESYKMPAPNSSGQNHSYMHPHEGKEVSPGNRTPAGPVKTGKNTY